MKAVVNEKKSNAYLDTWQSIDELLLCLADPDKADVYGRNSQAMMRAGPKRSSNTSRWWSPSLYSWKTQRFLNIATETNIYNISLLSSFHDRAFYHFVRNSCSRIMANLYVYKPSNAKAGFLSKAVSVLHQKTVTSMPQALEVLKNYLNPSASCLAM